MHLIQILLPLYDNEGRRFGPETFDPVRDELSGRFGGLTAFSRAPAEGLWREGGEKHRDDIVVYEVMADELDEGWWGGYRSELERVFRQDAIVIRAQKMQLL
jgi:hypothetical protein